VELVKYTVMLFRYVQAHRDGKLPRAQFHEWMEPVRKGLESCLQRAVDAGIVELSGSCADILEHREALWTFVERDGVEPTNNHAERELRSFVLWRKRSFGSQSERGDEYAERAMTVAHTARKQKQSILGFLTASCEAHLAQVPGPSLFAPVLAPA
jgi:transposase